MTTPSAFVADRFVYAAMATALAMMPALLWLPSVLGVLHDSYELGAADLGRLAFAELIGFMLATLFIGGRTMGELKRWVLFGCAVLVAANITLALFGPAVPFILTRGLAGLGAGMGFGYGLKLCSASARPTRSFGIFTALMPVVMIIGFQATAYMSDSYGRHDGVIDSAGMKRVATMIWVAYIALAAIAAAIFVTSQPAQASADSAAMPVSVHGLPEPTALIGILAIVLFFMAQGSIWVFLQILGVSHGFTVAGVANAMSGFAIAGIVGSLTAAAVPLRVPRWVLIGIALLVLCCGLYVLYVPASLIWYIAGCAVGGFYWNFVLPLVLGLLAHIDPTGRAPVLGGSMSSAGSALGPLLAGMLIQGTNYQPVGWLAGALCTAGLMCVILVERRGAAGVSIRS